ncbi:MULTISPECIES: ABC transporter permease [Halobacterium]|uniref:ABC transporter permease n=1 Tax=Halobacterium TaxID=2239 RepID=UPI000A5E7F9A|nr:MULTISPECIES: ABC transporter permease [Halobacterium]MCG1002825.1 ABC transporter permease [Halobacterium noricense]
MSENGLTRERVEDLLFQAGYWTVLALMLLPIAVVFVTSFQQADLLQFPPKGFSTKWYAQFFSSPRWLGAVVDSLVIGVGASAVSTVLGVAGSLAVNQSDSRLADVLVPIVLLPLLIPPVVLGLTFLIYFETIGIGSDYVQVILAHALWATPLAFFIMQSVFSRFDWNLRDAGMDLGARPHQTFYHVVLPNVKHGVIISALVTFIISLQEFIMALYLTGFGTRTIPVLAWNQLTQSLTPMVSVVSTFLILASVLAVLVSTALMNMEWLADQL